MSFKSLLDIGCFDWARISDDWIIRPLSTGEVLSAIVRSGGVSFDQIDKHEPELAAIARSMVRHGGQNVVGFLARQPAVLHPAGYVRVSVDGCSAGVVAVFLSIVHAEFGCGVYSWSDEETDVTRVITRLEKMASPLKA